jgi:hypothetical protein
MARERIKGGEKNFNSGKNWTRFELAKVLNLYINDPELKIHESYLLLQTLGQELGRTTRSVEAQLLMFRNLDKFGFYGYKNMNKLCKELWKEYIDQKVKNSF